MRRWAFNVAAAVSLLLCLAAAGGWIHSYFALDFVVRVRTFDKRLGEDRLTLASINGSLAYDRRVSDSGFASSARKGGTEWIDKGQSGAGRNIGNVWYNLTADGHHALGFGYFSHRFNPSAEYSYAKTQMVIPWWFIVLVFAVTPAWWVRVMRRDRLRRRKGCCRYCGYDLRATPAADGPLVERCPECGRTVEAPATMATA